jgi:alpha-beta hydrolase superfamily lysophospholipase
MLATVLNLYRLLAWAFALAVGGLSLLLMKVGLSQESLLFGLAGLLLSLAPLLDATGRARESRGWNRVAILFLAGWLGITLWLWRHAPQGRPLPDARVENRYWEGWRYPSASLGNLIPELDQLLLGLKLAPSIDPLLTPEESAGVAQITRKIYADLEADRDFRTLGTVLPHAYDDLWTDRVNHGHYFRYVPRQLSPSQPAPVLIFLHASGGNFKAYTWIFSRVADQLGMVLLVPSFGMGDWEEPGTSRTLRAVLEDVNSTIPMNRRQVHLVGLSNGGLGVCLAPIKMGEELTSLILLSPVLDKQAVRSAEFLTFGQTHPIHILTGAKDRRVPLDQIQQLTDVLKSNRVELTLETLPDADHFMLFTHQDEVLSRVTNWLRQSMETPR